MNSTLTAALAGDYIAGLHRDAARRHLAREAQAARGSRRIHRPGRISTALLPAKWRQAAT